VTVPFSTGTDGGRLKQNALLKRTAAGPARVLPLTARLLQRGGTQLLLLLQESTVLPD